MRAKLIALCAALLISALAVYYSQYMTLRTEPAREEIATPKIPFPDIGFTSPEGKRFHIADIKEQTILVHFWAAWCLPCVAEFPELLKYVAASNGKVALIAVSLDDNYDSSRAFLDRIGAGEDTPHVYWAWDKDKKLSLIDFDTIKVPETIVVDQDRMMKDKIVGPGPWKAAGKASGSF